MAQGGSMSSCWIITLVACGLLPGLCLSTKPSFAWDMVANMTFFHSCNESGLYSEEALEVITKFPFVTIEKGQSFHSNATGLFAEDKILAQLMVIKKRKPSISTIMYMNSIRDWYFYHMHEVMQENPSYWLRDKKNHPVYITGDQTFNPPKRGMLVFDQSNFAVRNWWISVCLNATKQLVSGTSVNAVDGCFCDSSQRKDSLWRQAFGDGMVYMTSNLTAKLASSTGGPLIGKVPDQEGVAAIQIESFKAENSSITEMFEGVARGLLVQAHVEPTFISSCDQVEDTLAAFLVVAEQNSFYGYGAWITADLQDVKTRWCPEWFERPLGPPQGKAVLADGVYKRSFSSGTTVTFDIKTKKGTINWKA